MKRESVQVDVAKRRPAKKRTCAVAATKSQWPPSVPDELADTVADRLKRSLRYAKLRNYDMADYLEVHRNTVTFWLSGRSRMLPVIMRVWADRTGVPLSWLQTGEWPDEMSDLTGKMAT